MTFRPARVCVMREELVRLTGHSSQALVLNQLLYWTQRCHDFDEMLAEENQRRQQAEQPHVNMKPFHGWIRKSLTDLGTETMLSSSKESMRRFVTALMERGWVESRRNPGNAWDRTIQYRVNLVKLSDDLGKIGFTVPGFSWEENSRETQKREKRLSRASSGSPQSPLTPSNSPSSKPGDSLINEGETCMSQKSPFDVSECSLQRPVLGRVKKKDSLKTKNKTSSKTTDVSKVDFEEPFLEEDGSTTSQALEANNNFVSQASSDDEEESQTPGKPTPSEGASAQKSSVAEAMVDIWNRVVEGRADLVRVRHREQTLTRFLQKHCKNDLSDFEAYCRRIMSSRFLMGEGSGESPWRMTLDAALEDAKAIKVFEGSYSLGDREIKPRLRPQVVDATVVPEISSEDRHRQQLLARIQKRFSDPEHRAFFEGLCKALPWDEYEFWLHKDRRTEVVLTPSEQGNVVSLILPERSHCTHLMRYVDIFHKVATDVFGPSTVEILAREERAAA